MKLKVLEAPAGRLEERFTDKKPLYDVAEAMAEANRCLYCADAPCIQACPTGIDIPTFIRKISTGNTQGAARTILNANLLGQSCAQVCPVEVLCAGACVYSGWGREPIAIGRLQRYAVENTLAAHPRLLRGKPPTGKRVALVGAGPASVAAAGLLALEGNACVLFERDPIPGGLNSLGIAPYKMKLPEALHELEWVMSLGEIELRSGVEVRSDASGAGTVSPETLLREFDAVFLGLGLGADTHLDLPGMAGPGVYGAVDLIESLKSAPDFSLGGAKRALVIGGGNTAIDIAHELALLGLEVGMVYRRSVAEMSGYAHEMEHARLDGVRLLERRKPVSIERDAAGRVTGLTVEHPQGREQLPADIVVIAIGQSGATQVAQEFPGVVVDAKGRVVVEVATGRTGNPRVWSGGDCVNGGKEVVNAVADAKVAVADMLRVLGKV